MNRAAARATARPDPGSAGPSPLIWAYDGVDWPNPDASHFVEAGGLTWHVQEAGEGPPVLLIHGTGASTHSWRDVLPALAQTCHVLAPDLPGHAFSERPPDDDLSITGMARHLAALLHELRFAPKLVAGHSAGAVILTRMALDGQLACERIVSLNGAFFPFGGLAGELFAPLARVIANSPFLPGLFARLARDPDAIDRLLDGTGSAIDDPGRLLYRRLFTNHAHVRATLRMMASWDLHGFQRSLACLTVPLVLVAGERDRAVPPGEAERLARRVAAATVIRLAGLGHLAHEEAPERVAALLVDQLGACP